MHGSGLQILLGDLRVLNFSIKGRLFGVGGPNRPRKRWKVEDAFRMPLYHQS